MKTRLFFIQLFILLMMVRATITSAQILNVGLNVQEQDQWCWAACSKSILNYYGKTVSQCEIADYTRTVSNWNNFGPVSCCIDASKGCNYWNYNWGAAGSIEDILSHWGVQDNTFGKALSLAEINTEISNGHPFVVRWGWTSGGGHFVVGHGVSNNTVYYMNPWPGEGMEFADYDWLVSDGNHTWTHTNTMVTPPLTSSIQVSLTTQANITNFTAPAIINLTANATAGSGSISKVEFYNGPTLLGTDNTSPYNYSWNNVTGGVYSLTAKAYNNLNVSQASTAVIINVNNLPSVSILSPANNTSFTAPASVNITANASDSDGTVTRVEFYNGSILLGTDYSNPYSYNWTNVPAGSYSLFARVYDNLNASMVSSLSSITVVATTNSLPIVNITSPVNNTSFTAPASVNITANASDSDGSVSKIEFYNGAILLGTDNTSPYSYTWTNVAAGTYSLSAKAYDNLNASKISTSTSITVTTPVNSLPVTNIISPINNTAFTAPASIIINAGASDSDGSISNVEFYNGSTLLGSDNTSPYSFTWSNVAIGTYSLTVKAYDNLNASTISSSISIIVNNASTCTAAQWNATIAYVGGNMVQYAGVKYLANWWTQNQRPDQNNGVQYSGQPWTSLGTCTSKMGYFTDSEPKTLSLIPNPMDYASVVHLNLLEDDVVEIDIVDELGRIVLNVYKGSISSGEHQFELNSLTISPGLYHLVMRGEKGNIGLNFIKK